jgi:hypothetical protein
MDQRRTRLGDVIDDYCPRCRLIMNHGVVGMVGDEVKKVRCNTCISEHVYRQGRLPASRRRQTSKLFEEVLRGMGRPGDAPTPVPEPPDETTPEPDPVEAPPEATELPRPEPTHRRLFTIRRAIAGKVPGRDPKKP